MGINKRRTRGERRGREDREERKKSEGLALLPTEHAKDQCRSAALAFSYVLCLLLLIFSILCIVRFLIDTNQ